MAKNIGSPSYRTAQPSDYIKIGDPVIFDGRAQPQELNKNHNWILANRGKAHATNSYPVAGSVRAITETAAAWADRLHFRITPRRHVPRLNIWCNASSDNVTGQIRFVIGATISAVLTFNGAASATTWQNTTIAVTGGTPPTTDLLQVQMQIVAPSTTVTLIGLTIQDDILVLGDMP